MLLKLKIEFLGKTAKLKKNFKKDPMVGAKDPYSRPKERTSEHSARPGIVNFPCYDGYLLSTLSSIVSVGL